MEQRNDSTDRQRDAAPPGRTLSPQSGRDAVRRARRARFQPDHAGDTGRRPGTWRRLRGSGALAGGRAPGEHRPVLAARAAAGRRHWRGLALVALGCIVGFPLLSALAMQSLPAAHGAVATGLLPAATAVMGVLRAGERPSKLFWLGCLVGVCGGAGLRRDRRRRPSADRRSAAAAAVGLGALGYAEGGRLAREMNGWRVICWALVLVAPLLIVPVLSDRREARRPCLAARLARLRLCGGRQRVSGVLRLVSRAGAGRRGARRADPTGAAGADARLVGAPGKPCSSACSPR